MYAPIAGVGAFTIQPNGTATGKYWLVAGVMNLGLDPIPWDAVLTGPLACGEWPFAGIPDCFSAVPLISMSLGAALAGAPDPQVGGLAA